MAETDQRALPNGLAEGTIVNWLVLVVGVGALLFVLYQTWLIFAAPGNILQQVLAAFFAAIVGVVAVSLAITVDFSWNPGEH